MAKMQSAASRRSGRVGQRAFSLAAAGAISLFAGRARATLLLYEPFNYSTVGQGLSGLVDGQAYTAGGQSNTTNGFTNTWYPRATSGLSATYLTSSDAAIANGNLSYAGLASSVGNSVNYGGAGYTPDIGWLNNTAAVVGPPATGGDGVSSGSIYYSLIFKVSDISNLAPRGFIAAFNNGTGSFVNSNPSSAPGSLWIRQSTVTGAVANQNFEIGIGKSNTADAAEWDGINHTIGDTIFVVAKYTFNTGSTTDDTVSLYINPDASTLGINADEGTLQQALLAPTTAGGGADVGANPAGSTPSIKSVFLRQGQTTTSVPNGVNVDELRVGTTWADVTPTPEPAALSFFAVGAAAIVARRRRQSH